jgi:MYXO-CTERM domain-containing protein
VEAGASVLLTRVLCLDGGEAVAGQCAEGFTYEGISFSNSERGQLSLYCPGADGGAILVDRAGYAPSAYGVRSGHSVEFDPERAEGEDNADPAAWCEASFEDLYQETAEGDANYGTPGEAGPCKTAAPSLPGDGPGCACSATSMGREGLWGLAAVLVLVPPRRRRR